MTADWPVLIVVARAMYFFYIISEVYILSREWPWYDGPRYSARSPIAWIAEDGIFKISSQDNDNVLRQGVFSSRVLSISVINNY